MAATPKKVRGASLADAMSVLNKTYGDRSVVQLGDEPLGDIEVIPSGSIALDVALGVGGYPRGRVIECYGPESSGKTTMALHAVASAQQAGDVAAFIDAEHALDPSYARALGVDTDHLILNQPSSGEEGLEVAETLALTGEVGIIVVDSVAALTPRAELDGSMGDSHVGLQARLMSQALRKITSTLSETGTTIIFINQLREKIGVQFGSPETTTGGKALKFYASIRIDVRRIETLKDGNSPYGNRTRVKVVKNKVAPPFRQAEFDVIYGRGIGRTGELVDLGAKLGIITKAGAWYGHAGTNLAQGRLAMCDYLDLNRELALTVEAQIRQHPGLPDAALAGGGVSPRFAPRPEPEIADRTLIAGPPPPPPPAAPVPAA